MADRPRILVLEGPSQSARGFLEHGAADAEVVRTDKLADALQLLRTQQFDGFFVIPDDPTVREGAANYVQARRILEILADAVAIVDADLRVLWANPTFEKWSGGGGVTGRSFYDALGSPEILGPDYSPFHSALAGKRVTTRLHCRDNRYIELHLTPVQGSDGSINQLISLGRDVTPEVQQQQKLEALHKAGTELAALSADQVAEMSAEERIEVLKQNIRRFTHDLLHYDVVEVRLIDRQTGRLEPLLQEGMVADAARRVLYPEAKGNGVTGFVAATGKSYLCPDTTHDPLYLEGAQDARSSLTVPLIYQDTVIGTFNVESPNANAFTEEDLQFAEIFSREIAGSLHTLDLLSAEKRSTASQSVEAVSREVALPVDEILTAATTVLECYVGHDEKMAAKLRQILVSARSIKELIQRVGEDLVPAPPAAAAGEPAPHARLKGMRVLVADNDERVRRSAHGILGRWGCVVETARDGQEALTMARLSTYDAILADIRLPDVSGYEVYRRMREAQPRARVILMTSYGYDPSHSLVKARQDGLRFVLFKPFRIDQLLDALDTSHDGPTPNPGTPAVARA